MDSHLTEQINVAHTIANTDEDLTTRSCAAIVTPGEASESEEEEEEESEEDKPPNEQSIEHEENISPKKTTDAMSQSQESYISDDTSLVDSIKYNTLLHRKLREKNEQLKRELAELACGPYNSATKEVSNITKHLIQSQKLVQNVSATLRKVSKELFSLELSIDSIRNDRNIFINDFIDRSNVSKDSQDNQGNQDSQDSQVNQDNQDNQDNHNDDSSIF